MQKYSYVKNKIKKIKDIQSLKFFKWHVFHVSTQLKPYFSRKNIKLLKLGFVKLMCAVC